MELKHYKLTPSVISDLEIISHRKGYGQDNATYKIQGFVDNRTATYIFIFVTGWMSALERFAFMNHLRLWEQTDSHMPFSIYVNQINTSFMKYYRQIGIGDIVYFEGTIRYYPMSGGTIKRRKVKRPKYK